MYVMKAQSTTKYVRCLLTFIFMRYKKLPYVLQDRRSMFSISQTLYKFPTFQWSVMTLERRACRDLAGESSEGGGAAQNKAAILFCGCIICQYMIFTYIK